MSPPLGNQGLIANMWGPNPTNPKKGPFVGRSELIDAGQRVPVMSSFECDTNEHISICLIRRDQPTPGQDPTDITSRSPLFAELQWGAGQEFETAVCDWIMGTTLTLPAGTISVVALYPPQPVGSVVPRQHVGVILAPASRPPASGVQPLARLTSSLGSVPVGVGIAVPNRAHAYQLVTDTPEAAGSYRVSYRYTAGVAAGADVIAADIPTSSSEQIALPNGTRSLYVGLIGGAAQKLSIVWSLAL